MHFAQVAQSSTDSCTVGSPVLPTEVHQSTLPTGMYITSVPCLCIFMNLDGRYFALALFRFFETLNLMTLHHISAFGSLFFDAEASELEAEVK